LIHLTYRLLDRAGLLLVGRGLEVMNIEAVLAVMRTSGNGEQERFVNDGFCSFMDGTARGQEAVLRQVPLGPSPLMRIGRVRDTLGRLAMLSRDNSITSPE
jgi:hypothetical protein